MTMPRGATTRPTTDRVREAVFNTLVAWADPGAPAEAGLAGLAVLDLFAGSGAIGLEAASRGAVKVTCVEADPRAAATIRRNAAATGLDVRVVTAKVESYLDAEGEPHDVVWLDPPYDLPTASLNRLLARLVDRGWVAERGLVAVERARRSDAPTWPAEMGENWNRRYGETTIYYALEGNA